MPEAPYRAENPEVANSGPVAFDPGHCAFPGGAPARSRLSRSGELTNRDLGSATTPRPHETEKHREMTRNDKQREPLRRRAYLPNGPVPQAHGRVPGNLHTAEVTGSIPVVPTHAQSIGIRALFGLGFCRVSGCCLFASRVMGSVPGGKFLVRVVYAGEASIPAILASKLRRLQLSLGASVFVKQRG